jgi:hypothetical protein
MLLNPEGAKAIIFAVCWKAGMICDKIKQFGRFAQKLQNRWRNPASEIFLSGLTGIYPAFLFNVKEGA